MNKPESARLWYIA